MADERGQRIAELEQQLAELRREQPDDDEPGNAPTAPPPDRLARLEQLVAQLVDQQRGAGRGPSTRDKMRHGLDGLLRQQYGREIEAGEAIRKGKARR